MPRDQACCQPIFVLSDESGANHTKLLVTNKICIEWTCKIQNGIRSGLERQLLPKKYFKLHKSIYIAPLLRLYVYKNVLLSPPFFFHLHSTSTFSILSLVVTCSDRLLVEMAFFKNISPNPCQGKPNYKQHCTSYCMHIKILWTWKQKLWPWKQNYCCSLRGGQLILVMFPLYQHSDENGCWQTRLSHNNFL